jgi:dTDP-4-dehydrorhamnose reductase
MRLVVTGGSGFLGSNIIRVALERYDATVLALTRTWRPTGSVPFACAAVDLTNRAAVREAVAAFRPHAIVHTAILNDLVQMYRDRRLAWDTYVEVTRSLTDLANDLEAKFVLVSTDWVFDGRQPGADETTPPNPINLYGALKLVCETVVQERAAHGVVARVSGVNGVHWLRPDQPTPQNAGFGYLANAAAQDLRKGRPFTTWIGAVNMAATPSLASDCADMIVKLAAAELTGTFHCCGGERTTRLELATTVADVFGADRALVTPGPPPPGTLLPDVSFPLDTSLDASRTAATLQHDLMDVEGIARGMRRQLETGQL